MEDSKAWYLSKGVWGSLLTVILSFVGVFVSAEMVDALRASQEEMISTAIMVSTAITGIIGLIGRLRAKTIIAPKAPTP